MGDQGYYQSSEEERASDTTYSFSNGSRFGNNPTGSLDDLNDLVGPVSRHNYLLFYPSLQKHQVTNIDEIRSARLFTIPTMGDEMIRAQQMTNLCVPITVMRLLSYAFVDFLDLHFTGHTTDLEEFKKSILQYPKDQSREVFIQELVGTCCEVISPQLLNEVYDPGDFHIASQEQKIREYIKCYPNIILYIVYRYEQLHCVYARA